MNSDLLRTIQSSYGTRSCRSDIVEYLTRRARERIFGVDKSIFDKTRRYYAEVRGERVTAAEALRRALNKAEHKDAWFRKERSTLEDKMHFYKEVEIYPFRQPYYKRHGGFRWYRRLVRHVERPRILEYGCGSAVLTEYLVEKFPEAHFTVADVPSVTLEFVKWKKQTYGYPYEILTIGRGAEGIPLKDTYDLIICQDVLEHTPNPLEIVDAFATHLSPSGVLVVDFIDDPGGENLLEAVEQREAVKHFLKGNLVTLKAIDEPRGNNGLYVKDVSSNAGAAAGR